MSRLTRGRDVYRRWCRTVATELFDGGGGLPCRKKWIQRSTVSALGSLSVFLFFLHYKCEKKTLHTHRQNRTDFTLGGYGTVRFRLALPRKTDCAAGTRLRVSIRWRRVYKRLLLMPYGVCSSRAKHARQIADGKIHGSDGGSGGNCIDNDDITTNVYTRCIQSVTNIYGEFRRSIHAFIAHVHEPFVRPYRF